MDWLGAVPDRLLVFRKVSELVIILCYANFAGPSPLNKKNIKIHFPVSSVSYFGSHAAWLLLSSFRCSNPHQLSDQRRLVHSALAAHHPAIIAKSLHRGADWEHIRSYQSFLPSSHESSIADKPSRNMIMSSCHKFLDSTSWKARGRWILNADKLCASSSTANASACIVAGIKSEGITRCLQESAWAHEKL